jgi:hypothetical protein
VCKTVLDKALLRVGVPASLLSKVYLVAAEACRDVAPCVCILARVAYFDTCVDRGFILITFSLIS